ncbi:unnamed protein product [Rhizophagus irregularis]|nr:unnamed protein product [Rhizophagus irregularis]
MEYGLLRLEEYLSASWSLKQRKEHERFQAVVMDVPKSVTNNIVYNAETPPNQCYRNCMDTGLLDEPGLEGRQTLRRTWTLKDARLLDEPGLGRTPDS